MHGLNNFLLLIVFYICCLFHVTVGSQL